MKFLPDNIDKENVMLVDMLYHGPRKENDGIDALDIIYKDLKTNEKYVRTLEKPKIEIYFAREEYRDYDYNKSFMEISKCDKHTCEYKSLIWYIARQAGDEYVNEIKRLLEVGDRRSLQLMHSYPYVFSSDIPIDTFYRAQWLLEYDNDAVKPISKIYLDIEVDTIDVTGFPRDGECPINAITIVDDIGNASYTFLLNNPDNPQIKELMDDIEGFINELHEMFDESYGVLDYRIYLYDDERDLIIDSFRLINTLKRDVCLIWNGGGFDIPYIIARLGKLNLKPEDVMCHKDFKYKTCRFIPDTRNFEIANKGDCLKLSSYTKFLDQMVLYAATRKGQSELRSNALNYIAQVELGDEKLDYSDEANIKTLPYKNYRKFTTYNIKDVLLQMGIERKVNDVENLFMRAYSNCTDVDKVFKQTVMLKSRAFYEYLLQGIAIGNNVNIFTKDSGGGFSGALVGNPVLNSETGIKLFGLPSMFVFDNVVDMDFSSMYPHIIISFNIERHTMIGKLFIADFNEERYDHIFTDNDSDDDVIDLLTGYDAGKDFMDNYTVEDWNSIGTKWFNLPNFNTMNMEFKKTFKIRDRIRYRLGQAKTYFLDKLDIE